MSKWTDLTTDRKMPHLTIDQRPSWLPLIRDRGRWRVIALGLWWSPWSLLALAFVGAAAAWALLGLVGRAR